MRKDKKRDIARQVGISFRGRNFGSNEGVIDAVDEYLGDRKEGFYFEEIGKLEQRWRKCIETNDPAGTQRWNNVDSTLIIA